MPAPVAAQTDRRLQNLPQRFRRRQPQALADLYNLYADLLYVLVKGIVKKPSVVDSLVEESFLRAWNRAEELEETLPSMGSQLLRIARECARDYLSFSSRLTPIRTPEFPTTALKQALLALPGPYSTRLWEPFQK
jgi:DNA-directed RNA polymerase specialized sigma24 family protein